MGREREKLTQNPNPKQLRQNANNKARKRRQLGESEGLRGRKGKERRGEGELIKSLNNVTFYQQDAVQVTQVATGTW